MESKMLILFMLVLPAIVVTHASADMVAYWPFDEGTGDVAYDFMGLNNAAMTDHTWVTPGKLGNAAIEVDGATEVNAGPGPTPTTEDLTLAWWMIDNHASYGTIMSKSTDSSASGYNILVRPDNEPSPLIFRIGGWQEYGGWGAECSLPAGAYNDGVWVHITCTYDSATDTATIYVNGELAPNGANNPKVGGIAGDDGYCDGVNNATEPLYIVGPPETFTGLIDEVAIWDTALTPDEVRGVYEDGPTPASGIAINPIPENGAVLIEVDTDISWEAHPDVNEPITFDVYFGSEPNELLPEWYGNTPIVTGTTDRTVLNSTLVSAMGGPLENDTTYYWRVDTHDPNDGEPILWPGEEWSFTTEPRTPVILSQPQGIYVFVGETAIFTIEYYSANDEPVTFEWFKEGEPGTILSVADTLTISNVQEADEGAYMCTLSNTYGDTTSEPAYLRIKKILGHWPFEENLTDIVGGNDGLSAKKPVYVEGIVDDGYAVEFGSPSGSSVDISTVPYTTASWTISFWEKSSTEDAGDFYETIVGSGETGWGLVDMGRYQMQRFYFGFTENYVYTPIADTYLRGQWNMLALTYDAEANQGTLYINGEPAIESGIGFPGFDPLLIVGRVPGREYYGVVDDLRLYNYPLGLLDVFVLYAEVTGETMCPQNPEADVSGPEGNPDCIVNIYDLVEVVADWLECNRLPVERCL